MNSTCVLSQLPNQLHHHSRNFDPVILHSPVVNMVRNTAAVALTSNTKPECFFPNATGPSYNHSYSCMIGQTACSHNSSCKSKKMLIDVDCKKVYCKKHLQDHNHHHLSPFDDVPNNSPLNQFTPSPTSPSIFGQQNYLLSPHSHHHTPRHQSPSPINLATRVNLIHRHHQRSASSTSSSSSSTSFSSTSPSNSKRRDCNLNSNNNNNNNMTNSSNTSTTTNTTFNHPSTTMNHLHPNIYHVRDMSNSTNNNNNIKSTHNSLTTNGEFSIFHKINLTTESEFRCFKSMERVV